MSDDEWAYLRDGFGSRNLRKEDLRRIFATHNIPYTNDMLKPQLLELFNTEIVPRRAELRAQFVDVAPSGLNIVDAGASDSDARGAAEPPPRSPRRLRSRTRSPSPPPARRARSPRRVASDGKQAAARLQTVPTLAPQPSQPDAPKRAPRSPRSPRRHANRKVELPGIDADAAPQRGVPLDDIKIKAPARAPRRSHDDDDSFTTDNVFQTSRKRASEGPEPAPKRSAKTPAKPARKPAKTEPKAEPKAEPTAEIVDEVLEPLPVAVSQEPTPDAVLLDEALVDALNAEVLWEQAQDANSQHAAELRMMLDLVATDPDLVHSAANEVVSELASELEHEPVPEEDLGEVPSSDIFEGVSELSQPLSQPPSQPPSHASRLPSASPNRTPAPRRRGFIPSFAELSVSRAFTEQLEPFMAASPTPPPRGGSAEADQAIPAPKPRLISTPPRTTPDVEVADPEEQAAHDLHEALEGSHARPRLPRIRVPRPRLPHIRLPRPRLPRVRFPRIPRIRLPRFRLPRPRLPRVQFPRLPQVHLPRPRLPHIPRPRVTKQQLRPVGAALALVFQRLLQTTASIVVLAFLASTVAAVAWYRGAYGKAEFCGVGVTAPHTYPEWTLVDVDSEAVSSIQNSIRDAMDAAWPECVPCPAFAQCYPSRVMICSSGYREALSPLSFGGLWPAPSRCLPDWEVQRKLEVLGERAAQLLRQRRANALCSKEGSPDTLVAADELADQLYRQKAPQLSDEEFTALWQEVLSGLPNEKYPDIEVVRHVDTPAPPDSEPELTKQTAEDSRSRERARNPAPGAGENAEVPAAQTFLRSRSDALVPLACRARLFLVGWVHNNRRLLVKLAVAVIAAATAVVEAWQFQARRRRQQRRVQGVLSRLQAQAAEAEGSAAGQRFVKTLEFRRGLPKPEWQALQRAIESDQNVRVRQIEINGEITRVWEWTG